MPIYAFQCDACGHQFDRLQKLSDPDPTECPVCAETQIRRQLTAPSFRLSGSGWYETDFKKDGDKKRNLTEKAEGSASESAKSEAKPEATSDAKSGAAKTETKPAAAAAAPAAKPTESKPAQSKSAESKPAT